MFVVSYAENDLRWDASIHTERADAEKQIQIFGDSLLDLQIDERDTFNPKREDI